MQSLLRLLQHLPADAPIVRPATTSDLDPCVVLALAFLRETNRPLSPDAPDKIRAFLEDLLTDPQTRLLLADPPAPGLWPLASVVPLGLILCRLAPPDLWDDRPIFTVDWWYVAPAWRTTPGPALALLRAAVAFGLASGARRARITADAASPLVARYRRLGFTPETLTLTLDLED